MMSTNTSLNIYRTHVNLKEIGLEGESFRYSRGSGELNKRLADLIGNHDYDVQLEIRPMGNVFEISGSIKTQLDVLCARCGRDMTENILEKFNEIILVLDERPRAGHNGHTGSSEEGPFCNYVTSYEFDLAEFVHEHIAAAEPYQPHCDKSDCEEIFKKLRFQILLWLKPQIPSPS